jgi:hypothetical protein
VQPILVDIFVLPSNIVFAFADEDIIIPHP